MSTLDFFFFKPISCVLYFAILTRHLECTMFAVLVQVQQLLTDRLNIAFQSKVIILNDLFFLCMLLLFPLWILTPKVCVEHDFSCRPKAGAYLFLVSWAQWPLELFTGCQKNFTFA